MDHPLGLAPGKIIAVHLNYRGRAAERGRLPSAPSYFLKPPSSLSWSGRPVVRPAGCELLTFEGEIAVVIGARARCVPPQRALEHVAGYTAANDFGVYDFRHADRGSNLRAKGQDGYTPVGPAILTGVDPGALRLRTYVNGELAQEADTGELLFGFDLLIADLSRYMTLEPGDLILAGTPAGSTVVKPGDVVEVELEDAGRLRNEVVAEPRAAPAAWGAQPRADEESRAAAVGRGRAAAPYPLDDPTIAALRTVSTATLSAQLRRRGIDHHFIEGVRPTRPDLRMVGLARTLRYLPLREDVFAEIGGCLMLLSSCGADLVPGVVGLAGAQDGVQDV
ncbi:fumarylacetoacetate hydrolase family protein, partial [Nonomuraea sp. NPDC059007]|uniref:fumarylacetoacetate hydrolase family protein n=1 Tax=Nonomuraea sp. NPDC059007 TaxID=3346692 RepID=UPI003678B58D